MTFVLLVAVMATSIGFFLGRRQQSSRGSAHPEPSPDGQGGPSSPFAALPLALGDVLANGTEERWLAGAVIAREGPDVVGALFAAPEGARQEAVAAFAAPRREIFWLSPVAVEMPREPPSTLDLDGQIVTRRRRVPVTFERMGQGAPAVGAPGIWAEYDSGRTAAIVITSGEHHFAFVGVRLDEDGYDRLGSATVAP